MQRRGIRMVSLNVNGINNPIKRGKVLTKFRKEEVQVIFYKKPMSSQEHENVKRYGYNNVFYSSFKQSHRRGVATLIKNSVKFETKKYVTGKEGIFESFLMS